MTASERVYLHQLLTGNLLWRPLPNPQTEAYFTEADEVYFGGAAGGGKALDETTPIATPEGWASIGDLSAGDMVFDDGGKPSRVIGRSSIMEDHPCYIVEFSDGSELIADADHRWLTWSLAERAATYRRSEQYRGMRRSTRPSRGKGSRFDLVIANMLREYDYLPLPAGTVYTTAKIADTLRVRGRTNHSIPVAGPLLLPDADLPIAPYTLGAWLGDGSSYGCGFTCHDREILENIESDGFSIRPRAEEGAYGILGLHGLLRVSGLLKNKHIPGQYLRGSSAQRLALLQGLMDTDGHACSSGHSEYTTTSPSLRDGALDLLWSLGIKAAACEGLAKLNGRVIGPKWRIKFVTALPAFRMSRKLDRQKREGFRGTHAQRYIVDVRPTPSVPVCCIAVDSPTNLYLAGRQMIPTHNTDLLLGLALTAHKRSIVYRREYKQLADIVTRSEEMLKRTSARINRQEMKWRDIPGGRTLEFGAVQYPRDVQRYQGRAHDLKCFDELPHFTEAQYLYLIGWNRSVIKGQRCRVVAAGNPPLTPEGLWVVQRWAAWLDDRHPNPAMPGELRWYVVIDGEDTEVEGPEPIEHKHETLLPKSRTFIPALLKDNPYLEETEYRSTLQRLPEPLRSKLLYGDFNIGFEDHPQQVIPTEWVMAAEARWKDRERPDTPMTAMGVDVARGGDDETVIAERYDNWFAPLRVFPGKSTPDGPSVAREVAKALAETPSEGIRPNVDVIGVGSSVYDTLKLMGIKSRPINVAEASTARDRSKRLSFYNKRAQYWWQLREALDPTSGMDIALPPNNVLRADLCAPRWKITLKGILIEPKEDIRDRIHRSTNAGDAIILASIKGKGVPFG